MYTLISLDNPIQSSIVFYLLILSLLYYSNPKYFNLNDRNNKYKLPLIIFFVSILSYYIFTWLCWFKN